MSRQAASAFDRILALGERASSFNEAELARRVGVSRERIRQLRARLPHKPVNRREVRASGYDGVVERAFYAAMRRGIDRLVALVDVRGDDECWPWLGHKSNGYGILARRGVHRRIYERERGPIPRGKLVIHKFGGRPCCNPRHLVLSTSREITWRDLRDGARVKMSDELRGLTPARVRAIRRAYAKLPKLRVHWRGHEFERVPCGCNKALCERFGLKNGTLLAHIATGKSGSWILSGEKRGHVA